jgi:hypothetical protein
MRKSAFESSGSTINPLLRIFHSLEEVTAEYPHIKHVGDLHRVRLQTSGYDRQIGKFEEEYWELSEYCIQINRGDRRIVYLFVKKLPRSHDQSGTPTIRF